MKSSLLKVIMSCLIMILLNNTAFSANEYFRSVGSGNWNAIATWQMSTNGGGTWIAATSTPTDTSGIITIQSPNTVTVTVSVSADQLVVNNGGTISINAGIILTIKDGSGTDLLLNSGGTISGSGTLQTQGAAITIDNRNGSTFSAALEINSGTTSAFEATVSTSIYKGTITVDAGATFAIVPGGYTVQANNNVVNNGIITNSSGFFIMRGASLTNNDTIRGTNFYFDSTTSLSGTGAYTGFAIAVRGTGNVSLANNITMSPTSTFSVNSGGIFNPNGKIFTFNSGTFVAMGTVSNSGKFQTQGTVSVFLRSGSSFNDTLKINTGTTSLYNDQGPFLAILYGTLIIDAGAIFTSASGGYTNQANNTITNNGTLTGGPSSIFRMRGSSLANSGSINPPTFSFDSTTTISGSGTYGGNALSVGSTGIVTLGSTCTFAPISTFTINSGGVFTPNFQNFTFTSGTLILLPGGTVSGTGSNAGTLNTQGAVTFDFRSGAIFNSALRVQSGTLTAYNSQSPFVAVFNGTITVDAGSTLTCFSGGYTNQANNIVLNNGTITGGPSSTFTMRGSFFTNNSIVSTPILRFDSTTSIAGGPSQSFASNAIIIGSTGNVTLFSDITFSPGTSFTVSGTLNPNTHIFTFNSGILYTNNGSTVSNSGTFQSRNAVSLIIRGGSNFNAPLKVNTGTSTSYDDGSPFYAIYKGTITVDAGATLTLPGGGYFIQALGNVTNNGTITGGGGSSFRMRGASLANNNSIMTPNFYLDSTIALSGTGTYTDGAINITSSGNVSLSNNVTFAPTSSMSVSGILNPNTKTFTLGSGVFTSNSGSTISNSGIFQTQGSLSLVVKSGSNFNAPLKVNTGSTFAYDDGSPFTATFNSTITIDTGATLTAPGGGYSINANSDITNNGTLTNGGANVFRFAGTILTNNGNITANSFNFQSGSHTLQGTGSWGSIANILNGSTVTLASNHQMQSVTINSGGTFNLSTFKLSLTASNPIANSGTFNTTTGTVEYDGSSAQSITTGITYNRLRINNPAGTSLPGAVTVNDTLSVVLGSLNMGTNILTIAPTGYLTETPGNTVTGSSGYITTTRNLNAPSSLNVGGLGAVLTTTVNLGSTEIRRGHAVQSGLGGNTSILRYFDITPTTNTGLNATLVFKFDDSELNGKVKSALMLFRSTNTGSTWTAQGGAVNTSLNTITLSSIPAFSRWSASSTSAVASTIKLIMEAFYNTGTTKLNMRDTVRAYLRNTTTPFAVVDSAKSIIDSNTYTGSFLFSNAGTGTYYIQLKHRNSIETWSKTGQSYTLGSALNYDFTTDSAKAFGNNMKKVTTLWTIFSGDPNQDGFVNLTDITLIYNDANTFLTGYVSTDVNGDRVVNLTDLIAAYNNSNAFVSKITP